MIEQSITRFPSEPLTEPRRLAVVGDSIVAGGDWEGWLPDCEVVNLAVPGHTTDDMLGRLADVVDASPHEIVVHVGSNDVGARRSVERIVRNVEIALVHVRRELPGTRLLLTSILPRELSHARTIHDANIHLRQFCSTVRAHYLDLWPVLATEDGRLRPELTHDGLHLNEHGYDLWREELLPALERMRGQPPMSRPLRLVGSVGRSPLRG